MLQHAFIQLSQCNLLIFDECHHARKEHPFAVIMNNYYKTTEKDKRPRVLGMTASVVFSLGKVFLKMNIKGERLFNHSPTHSQNPSPVKCQTSLTELETVSQFLLSGRLFQHTFTFY
jgi:hypothetical protein